MFIPQLAYLSIFSIFISYILSGVYIGVPAVHRKVSDKIKIDYEIKDETVLNDVVGGTDTVVKHSEVTSAGDKTDSLEEGMELPIAKRGRRR